jgi:putative addiction module component (TIGR02574 family)
MNAFFLVKFGTGVTTPHMSIAEIRNLPLREKLQILEVIWDDLSARVDEMSVSPAVRDLLDERMERIQNGSVDVHDWDSVKFAIGRQ